MGSIVLLIMLLYYVFAVIAVKLYGPEFPELFGTLGKSFFTLFTVMTLEGWVDGVVKPIMEKFPRAWLFFVIFIVVTTFMVLNLFIGVVVNAMQKEHEKAEKLELEHEREIVHEEAAPILARDPQPQGRGRGAAQGAGGEDLSATAESSPSVLPEAAKRLSGMRIFDGRERDTHRQLDSALAALQPATGIRPTNEEWEQHNGMAAQGGPRSADRTLHHGGHHRSTPSCSGSRRRRP